MSEPKKGRDTGGHGAEPPPPTPVRPFIFPEVVSERLENGLELRVAKRPRIPVASVHLVLNAGESWLDDGRAGLAVLTGDALEGGTEHRSGPALAESLERLGVQLSVSTGWDATTISISCLADRLAEAMPLLAEVVLEPGFPEDEVARVRNQQLAALEQRRMEPSKLAVDRVVCEIFADHVPFGRPLSGRGEAVAAMDAEASRGFTREAYRPGDGGLVVAGDVDPDEIRAMAGKHLGGWSGRGRGRPDFGAEPRSRERRVVVVDRPGSVQSEIRIGHVGIERTSEDFIPLSVFNTLLGGSFTSRLNLRLREERGFTYGVRSRFAGRRLPGPFTIGTAVESAVTAAAVADLVEVVEEVVDDGPEAREVESAKDYLIGVFPLRFETTDQVGTRLSELIVYGLPDDYHATYRDRVRAISTEDAAAAARRSLRPSEFTVVVVGDASSVADELRGLELGPVDVVEEG